MIETFMACGMCEWTASFDGEKDPQEQASVHADVTGHDRFSVRHVEVPA